MNSPALYRIEAIHLGSMDEYGGFAVAPRVHLCTRELPIIKTTPKGAWVDLGCGMKRFVLSGSRKRFACPSVGEALDSFISRKVRQIKILRSQIEAAEVALDAARGEQSRVKAANGG